MPDIVTCLLPKRVIRYYSAGIWDDEDVEVVIGHYADATEGAWDLSELSAKLDEDKEVANVEFVVQGKHVEWEFDQFGEHVTPEFDATLESYAAGNLPEIL